MKQFLLLLIGCSFIIQTARSQGEFTIKPFTPGDGLVSADIITLFQDSKNYLWVGHAAGASRYDGYQFENFLFTAEQQVGKTYCITEDPLHNIWIGAENGLFLFRGGKLQHIAFDNQQRPVYTLTYDHNENLWIGSSEGPSVFSKNEWQQAITTHRLNLHEHIVPAWRQYFSSSHQVPFLSAGKDGAMYFGDGYAIFLYWNNTITSVWKSAGGYDPLKNIIAISKDSVFICSSYSGLQAIENGQYRKSTAKFGTSNALIKKDGRYYYYCAVGIYEVDPKSLNAHQLFPFPDEQWEWGSTLLQDNENNFWVGTHEQLCFARRNFFTSISQPSLTGFDELYFAKKMRDGSLVCGSNRGRLFRRNNDSDSFYLWKNVFPVAPPTDMYEDSTGAAWLVSSYQGISLVEKNTVQRFTVEEGLRDNTNFMLFKTSGGELFAGGDGGVSSINKNEEGEVKFTNYPFKTGSTDYAIVYCGLEKPSGGLIFGSNRGLLEIKGSELVAGFIKNSSRRNYNITDMRKDAQGNIWISTVGDGILICNFENDTLIVKQQLKEENGLPSLIWLRLLIDNNNIVWAAGYNGITRIERTGNEFFIAEYGRMHGFIPRLFHTIKMMQDEKGIIWVATSSGLMNFDPRDPGNSVYPTVQLNTDSSIAPGIKLPYHSNSISFSYTGIYFSDPSSVLYAYRLIGQDTNWIYAGDNRSISFRHLAPGKYEFEIKAAAGTNRWSPTTSFPFSIEPPFWERWWFIVLSVFVAATILFAIIRMYVNNIQRREEEKTKVQQLISERQQAQLEALQNKQKAMEARLQSMRLQMNPHFLFNALNSIQQMILAGDETIATRCLSKFSKLLRLILVHSDKEKVTLREELETLRLYVELESFRFKERFEYFVTCDNAIDQDDTRIPTLLIQPFVENAIWHGLMHKEGSRRLQVHFTEEKDMLICIIEDNGIGRQASGIIKENSLHEHHHTGKGIAVATERLKIFGENSGNGSHLEIIDLKDHRGLSSGTRVVVKFPV